MKANTKRNAGHQRRRRKRHYADKVIPSGMYFKNNGTRGVKNVRLRGQVSGKITWAITGQETSIKTSWYNDTLHLYKDEHCVKRNVLKVLY